MAIFYIEYKSCSINRPYHSRIPQWNYTILITYHKWSKKSWHLDNSIAINFVLPKVTESNKKTCENKDFSGIVMPTDDTK